jgi:hypothetical protein
MLASTPRLEDIETFNRCLRSFTAASKMVGCGRMHVALVLEAAQRTHVVPYGHAKANIDYANPSRPAI